MSNEFFKNNTIGQIKTFSSTFYNSSNLKTNKIKRVTSLSTAKLNPQKFLNRQVFNQQFYVNKPFNIAVEFRKQRNQQNQQKFSFDNSSSINSIKKNLQKQNKDKFTSNLQNLTHLLQSLHQSNKSYTLHQSNNTQNHINNTIRTQLVRLKQCMDRIFKVIQKQLQDKQSKYLSLIWLQKSIPQNFSNQHKPVASITSRIKTSEPLSKKIENEKKVFPLLQQKVSILTEKHNNLQFVNKKNQLQIQKLQQQNQQKTREITQLKQIIKSIELKVNNVNKIQDDYQYRIAKLKEELKVAHVIKEQTLQDKMKYILNV